MTDLQKYRGTKDEQVFIRVSTSLKRWIVERAIEDGRTMSAWIAHQLELIRKTTPPARR